MVSFACEVSWLHGSVLGLPAKQQTAPYVHGKSKRVMLMPCALLNCQ